MAIKNRDIIFSIIIFIALVGLLHIMSSKGNMEGYWSLPFGGGEVRTYAQDPHKIESPLGIAMDEQDDNSTWPL